MDYFITKDFYWTMSKNIWAIVVLLGCGLVTQNVIYELKNDLAILLKHKYSLFIYKYINMEKKNLCYLFNKIKQNSGF